MKDSFDVIVMVLGFLAVYLCGMIGGSACVRHNERGQLIIQGVILFLMAFVYFLLYVRNA